MKLHIERFGARRHSNVKCVDIDAVAHPVHLFAVCCDNEPGQFRNGSGWRMIAGNPLGVQERQFARCDWNPLVHVQNTALNVGDVYQ